MTFNIHHGRGSDKVVDIDRIAKVINKSDAHIIGLNEVDKHFSKRSMYEDQVSALAKRLKMNAVYGPTLTIKSRRKENKVRQYGNALLTRFPLRNQKNHQFNFIPGLIEGRALLEARITINEIELTVLVTHFSLNPILQQIQTKAVLSKIKDSKNPIILLGDLNLKPKSVRWNQINHFLSDSFEAIGKADGHTYPSSNPRKRLDYIFLSPSLQVVNSQVLGNLPTASDHLPVKTTITL